MATEQETALILMIARINQKIADREAGMLASISTADELGQLVYKLADLHQSRWEREKSLKARRLESNTLSAG
jgi:cell division protein ZapA (FtsZ GTPase activity inhibitor)